MRGFSIKNDLSRLLRSIPGKPVRALPANNENDADGLGPAVAPVRDTVVQSTAFSPAMPAAGLNFDGIGFPGVSCNCAPPDTNGEAGATQYVQSVNEGYQVFNKSTGASILGPIGISTIWTGFGGVCETNGDGDPIVLYDQLANRWLVSQFAGSGTPTDECIAISTTSDATGSYYRYGFHLGSNFYDYPHLAVWPDAYYMSDNVFSGNTFLGPQPFAFDRNRMLAGLPATFQTVAPLGGSQAPFLPADVDGSTPPPAGAPESFVQFPAGGAYTTYHFHVDWTTPANTTFTNFANPPAAPFTQLCTSIFSSRRCVPQSGVSSSSYLDGLADRPMFRLAYRNFGDHESVVGNFTVQSGNVAGIRWFELRGVTAGPVTVFQQSTYQPDSTWRWMGSIAMDHAGNIGLGFSASSSAINPQIRYAGRLVTDPLNTLGQGETTLFSGTGSQSGTSNRWGDYSDLTIDPVDDCTFWFTTEYYSTTTQFNWRTRIGSFKFAGCSGTPATGTVSGKVTNSATAAAISGATVGISGGGSTTTDGSGNYTIANVTPGSNLSVTASKTGFTSSTIGTVTVAAGVTTTQNFALTSTTGTISGKVTNSATAAAISGATVTATGGATTTTDGSGNYTLANLAPSTYSITVTRSGYTGGGASGLTVTAGVVTTANVALTAVAPTTGTISGKVTITGTSTAISGASVTATGGATTTTDGNGNYSLANLTPGSYDVSVTKSGYGPGSANGLTVTAGAVTPANVSLTAVAPTTGTISGKVSDASTSAAISGATVTATGGATTTTDGSGNYTLANLAPSTYSLTVTRSGYMNGSASGLTVTAGAVTPANVTMTSTSSAPAAANLSASTNARSCFFIIFCSGGGVRLSWNVPANNGSAITGYSIYRSTTSTVSTSGAAYATTTSTSYTDSSTTRNVVYYYKVVAVNAIGPGADSNVASATAG